MTSFIAPEYKGKKHTVDVDGAKKELTDAGFKLEGNTLKDPTGKPVTITLTDPAGWSDYMTDLEIIKDNLSTIGIKATVDKANQDAWFKNIDEGNFDAAHALDQRRRDAVRHLPEHHGRHDPQAGRHRRRQRQLRPLQQPRGDHGAGRSTPTPTDDAARTTALNTLQKIMVEQMPMIPTSAPTTSAARTAPRTGSAGRTSTNPYGAGAADPAERAATSSCTSSPPAPDGRDRGAPGGSRRPGRHRGATPTGDRHDVEP